ncbi:hypothetical protein QJQ45_018844 [Haematococcus lacustris]|nr:hypothetical protein QJQ45_018844 [Haematococcus lacustris]
MATGHNGCRLALTSDCITEAMRMEKQQCPVCKATMNRRDIGPNALMEALVYKYARIEALLGKPIISSQLPDLDALPPSPRPATSRGAKASAASKHRSSGNASAPRLQRALQPAAGLPAAAATAAQTRPVTGTLGISRRAGKSRGTGHTACNAIGSGGTALPCQLDNPRSEVGVGQQAAPTSTLAAQPTTMGSAAQAAGVPATPVSFALGAAGGAAEGVSHYQHPGQQHHEASRGLHAEASAALGIVRDQVCTAGDQQGQRADQQDWEQAEPYDFLGQAAGLRRSASKRRRGDLDRKSGHASAPGPPPTSPHLLPADPPQAPPATARDQHLLADADATSRTAHGHALSALLSLKAVNSKPASLLSRGVGGDSCRDPQQGQGAGAAASPQPQRPPGPTCAAPFPPPSPHSHATLVAATPSATAPAACSAVPTDQAHTPGAQSAPGQGGMPGVVCAGSLLPGLAAPLPAEAQPLSSGPDHCSADPYPHAGQPPGSRPARPAPGAPGVRSKRPGRRSVSSKPATSLGSCQAAAISPQPHTPAPQATEAGGTDAACQPPSMPGTSRGAAARSSGSAPHSAAAAGQDTGSPAARRVVSRLLPWVCSVCTLHNKFSARKCMACKTVRPADAALVTPSCMEAARGLAAGGLSHQPAQDAERAGILVRDTPVAGGSGQRGCPGQGGDGQVDEGEGGEATQQQDPGSQGPAGQEPRPDALTALPPAASSLQQEAQQAGTAAAASGPGRRQLATKQRRASCGGLLGAWEGAGAAAAAAPPPPPAVLLKSAAAGMPAGGPQGTRGAHEQAGTGSVVEPMAGRSTPAPGTIPAPAAIPAPCAAPDHPATQGLDPPTQARSRKRRASAAAACTLPPHSRPASKLRAVSLGNAGNGLEQQLSPAPASSPGPAPDHVPAGAPCPAPVPAAAPPGPRARTKAKGQLRRASAPPILDPDPCVSKGGEATVGGLAGGGGGRGVGPTAGPSPCAALPDLGHPKGQGRRAASRSSTPGSKLASQACKGVEAAAGGAGGMADGQGSMPWPSTPWSCRHTDWLLMGSGLDDAGKAGLKRLAAVAGARLVESWCHGVTHVVCRTDAEQRARRTMKYLMGVAHGCWVVDCAWVAACLSLGGAAPEASYQVHGDSNGGMGGPAAGRSRLASGGLAVLSGHTLMLAGKWRTRGLPEVIVAANPPRRAAKLARTDAAVSANAGASGGGCEDAATEAKGTPLALYDVDCCAATGIEPQLAGAAAVRAGMPLKPPSPSHPLPAPSLPRHPLPPPPTPSQPLPPPPSPSHPPPTPSHLLLSHLLSDMQGQLQHLMPAQQRQLQEHQLLTYLLVLVLPLGCPPLLLHPPGSSRQLVLVLPLGCPPLQLSSRGSGRSWTQARPASGGRAGEIGPNISSKSYKEPRSAHTLRSRMPLLGLRRAQKSKANATQHQILERPQQTAVERNLGRANGWTDIQIVPAKESGRRGCISVKGVIALPAPPDLVWRCLRDYESSPRVFSNVEACSVQPGSATGTLEVLQTCRWSLLALSGTFDVRMAIHQDMEQLALEFNLIESSFMRGFDGRWKVSAMDAPISPAWPGRSHSYSPCSSSGGSSLACRSVGSSSSSSTGGSSSSTGGLSHLDSTMQPVGHNLGVGEGDQAQVLVCHPLPASGFGMHGSHAAHFIKAAPHEQQSLSKGREFVGSTSIYTHNDSKDSSSLCNSPLENEGSKEEEEEVEEERDMRRSSVGQDSFVRTSPLPSPHLAQSHNPVGQVAGSGRELCGWTDREALPPIGKEYQQRYKLVNDRLPKGRQRLHWAAEYRRGIDGRALGRDR